MIVLVVHKKETFWRDTKGHNAMKRLIIVCISFSFLPLIFFFSFLYFAPWLQCVGKWIVPAACELLVQVSIYPVGEDRERKRE